MIIGVHPIDGDLRFLKKMAKGLASILGKNYYHSRLSNNSRSHSHCLNRIYRITPQDTLLFMCHGRSDGILGCRFQIDSERMTSYNHGLFINCNEMGLFREKKIFCMSCNSNKLGKKALQNRARVFLGFDDIYFDTDDSCPDSNRYVVDISKYHLRRCVYSALINSWENDLSFNQCASLLKLLINKTNDDLVLGYRKHRGRKFYFHAANNLQLIKEGIRVWGDGNLTFRN